MKGLILNSGLGKRMGDLTLNKPKCLVTLNNKETVLSRQINQLLECNISEIIITTGPFKGMIREYIELQFPELDITYIQNDDYEITNYIYSMYLADKHIREDIILLHGDIVTESEVFSKLLTSCEPNLVVVDSNAVLPEKDFKGRIINDKVNEIGLDVYGDNCKFLLPVYKLSKESMSLWMDEIRIFKKNNNLKVYAENAFNNISEQMNLKCIELGENICMEIDNLEDYTRSVELVKGI